MSQLGAPIQSSQYAALHTSQLYVREAPSMSKPQLAHSIPYSAPLPTSLQLHAGQVGGMPTKLVKMALVVCSYTKAVIVHFKTNLPEVSVNTI